MQALAACLCRHARSGETVTVGYSGGLDSTVLLHASNHHAADAGLRLSALHVHHGLSPNADAWADSCGRVCEQLGIPLIVRRVEVPARSGEGIEAAARRLRHKALAEHSADWILLAHHADDQAEARFPRAGEQLAAAATHFGETEGLLDDLATLDLGTRRPEFPLPLALLRQLSDARARNLLRAMLAWHTLQAPDERRLREFVRQLRTAGNDRHPRLDLAPYSLWCAAGSLHLKLPG